ncbi:hypothetical protein Mapa_014026 [Marchantia paleacea]|nr:hypothetical protein Mapa_014026 [Marchantia paleacea]
MKELRSDITGYPAFEIGGLNQSNKAYYPVTFGRRAGRSDMVRAMLLPPAGQAHSPGLIHVLDLLERHCLAPDGSLLVNSTYQDLLLAREEMAKERLRYFEAMALYCEAVALVEEYHQAVSVANAGGIRDLQAVFGQLGLRCAPQVYEALEQRLVIAESAQRLRLPLIAKDGELPDEDMEKWSIISRSSFDSSSTTSISTNTTVTSIMTSSTTASTFFLGGTNPSELADPGIGGPVHRMLGLTPTWFRQSQLMHAPFTEDSTVYQMALIPQIESRLRSKCDKLAAVSEADQAVTLHPSKSTRLTDRVKVAVETIEAEEWALLEDLFSADRKFSEYYNVLEQILGVLLRLVKDFKLTHQFQYDGMRKAWLCKRCQTMNTKLRVLEHLLLRDTYTQDSIPALHKIRSYLVEANEEATAAYNRAVTRLREYQGVDQYFDDIARRYHDLITKLEGIQWTIRQVEMDLNNAHDHS